MEQTEKASNGLLGLKKNANLTEGEQCQVNDCEKLSPQLCAPLPADSWRRL
jgi:hypothetical protein